MRRRRISPSRNRTTAEASFARRQAGRAARHEHRLGASIESHSAQAAAPYAACVDAQDAIAFVVTQGGPVAANDAQLTRAASWRAKPGDQVQRRVIDSALVFEVQSTVGMAEAQP